MFVVSSVKKLRRRDPKKPRFLGLVFEKNSEDVDGVVEFTTEEAAIEWAREFQGALFLFRHRRRQVLRGNDAETAAGIRISIPLHRIDEVESQNTCFNSMPVASLKIQLSPHDNVDVGGEESHILRFFQMLPSVQWSQLGDFVKAAKSRHDANGSESDTSPMVIDFSPSIFLEDNVEHSDGRRDTEKAVRNALAVEEESELWGKTANCTGFANASRILQSPRLEYDVDFVRPDNLLSLAMSLVSGANPSPSPIFVIAFRQTPSSKRWPPLLSTGALAA
jgi:sterol 3beta-glucosyltransferase